MRKRLLPVSDRSVLPASERWLNVEEFAEVEISSEDSEHPIESALISAVGDGWRASLPGRQTIRLLFEPPQDLHRIRLRFVCRGLPRTQEYVLCWSDEDRPPLREIVRQQWNFNPATASSETEEHRVELRGVKVLELTITPDIGNEMATATLAEFRVA